MRNLNNTTKEINNITDQARTQFFLEDKLERDYASGFISEEQYNDGLRSIFYSIEELYGF